MRLLPMTPALLIPLVPLLARADDPRPGARQDLAAALRPFVDRGELAGAVVLVADREKVLALESVGYADVGAKTPLKPDALFWIASQSKPVTAAALMIL